MMGISVPTDSMRPTVERRHEDMIGVSSAKVFLFSALLLTILMLVAFMVIILVKPDVAETRAVRYMGFFLAMCIAGLFAGAGINITNVLNGHTAVMVRLAGKEQRAQGIIEGLKANPDVNIS